MVTAARPPLRGGLAAVTFYIAGSGNLDVNVGAAMNSGAISESSVGLVPERWSKLSGTFFISTALQPDAAVATIPNLRMNASVPASTDSLVTTDSERNPRAINVTGVDTP